MTVIIMVLVIVALMVGLVMEKSLGGIFFILTCMSMFISFLGGIVAIFFRKKFKNLWKYLLIYFVLLILALQIVGSFAHM